MYRGGAAGVNSRQAFENSSKFEITKLFFLYMRANPVERQSPTARTASAARKEKLPQKDWISQRGACANVLRAGISIAGFANCPTNWRKRIDPAFL